MDLVIAVDVSEPLFDRAQLSSLFSVTWQVVSLQTRGTIQAQLDAADVVVIPDLDGIW